MTAAARPPRLRTKRTLKGLEAEYLIAMREGKTSVAKRARMLARAVAMSTGQITPEWAQGWGP